MPRLWVSLMSSIPPRSPEHLGPWLEVLDATSEAPGPQAGVVLKAI